MNKTFTDEDLALVSKAILAACDKLDGLEDGLIANFTACKLCDRSWRRLTCKGPKEATCLSAVQISALEKVFGGPKNSKGEALIRRLGLGRRDLQPRLARLENRHV